MGRILFVNLLGIGNCILSTPAVAALAELGHQVDALVVRRKHSRVAFEGWDRVRRIHCDKIDYARDQAYDIALWAHPFCAEYRHPEYALRTVDPSPGDTRPYHWRFKRHEVEEVFGLARSLGYAGTIPPLRRPHCSETYDIKLSKPVAIGIGYFRFNGMWKDKHWGNRRFTELCIKLSESGYSPVLVGDDKDQEENGWLIARGSGATSLCGQLPLDEILGVVSRCIGFIGNDTGLMHAAAAYELPTLGIFKCTDPVKNRPWGKLCAHVPADLSADQMLNEFEALLKRA